MPTTFRSLGHHRVNPPLSNLLRVSGRADGRDDDHPRLLQAFDDGPPRGLGEGRHSDTLGDQVVDPLVHISSIGAEVYAERCVGRRLDLADSGRHLVEGHGGRCDDSQAAGLRRGRGQARTGHPAHASLDDRVSDPDQIAESRV